MAYWLLLFLPFGASLAHTVLAHELLRQGRQPTLDIGDSIGNGKLASSYSGERVEPLSSAAPPSIVSGDGGDLLPSFPHTRFLPPEENGPSQAAPPSSSPNSDRDGIAFISSSPAISLPSEESESADVRRLPDSGNGNYVIGRGIGVIVAFWVALMVPLTLGSA